MTNNNWIKSISKSYSHLDEARKMKPTSTDRVQNEKIKKAAISAHQIAATAISSIPSAVPHPEYSGGVHGYDDPVHASIMDHLGDVAKTVTDPEQAILLVAKKHGVDPKAAIAALSTSAPMSPRETVNRMAGLKVESINNNMKKNNKSWIQSLSESYIRHSLNENSDTHQRIVDFLADRATQYPHKINKKTFRPDREASAAHIREILNATGPHTDAAAAVEAIRPHAIEGNGGLDEIAYTEGDYGTDITELPNYEEIAAENEERFASGLTNDLHRHITGK